MKCLLPPVVVFSPYPHNSLDHQCLRHPHPFEQVAFKVFQRGDVRKTKMYDKFDQMCVCESHFSFLSLTIKRELLRLQSPFAGAPQNSRNTLEAPGELITRHSIPGDAMKVFKEYESKILLGAFCLDIKAGGLLWQRHSYCDM